MAGAYSSTGGRKSRTGFHWYRPASVPVVLRTGRDSGPYHVFRTRTSAKLY